MVVLLQEETKPAAQEPAPNQSGQQSPPAKTQAAPQQTPPASTPEAGTPATQTETPVQPPAQAAPAEPAITATPKPKTQTAKPRKARVRKRPAKPAADPNAPTRKVVSNGSTSDPVVQISSGKSASQQVSSTNSLLDSTNSNLKKLADKQLAPAQQDMVKQIHAYLEQSKAASALGDLQGAHNLAFKAHLLSEELLKR